MMSAIYPVAQKNKLTFPGTLLPSYLNQQPWTASFHQVVDEVAVPFLA